MPFKITVLASTNGTDLQAIIDEMNQGLMPGIEILSVISNKEKAGALEKARKAGIPALHIKDNEKLLKALKVQNPDLICLIGYMRIIPSEITHAFPYKIINVHPSLIPKYSGKNYFGKSVHEAVIENKETETGMTIHYVDEGVDTGEIIMQKACPVTPEDTPDTLSQKVQSLEKKCYPEVIRNLAQKSHDQTSQKDES